MHSMLRQNQIRLQDVKPFVRTFDRKNPVLSPQEWATREGSLFDAGMLVFLLEPARRPPGLTSFAARQQEADGGGGSDLFRVKDLSIVLDKVEGKSWALNITPSAYERRFVDALFRDKATKSVLDGVDFNYLVARPRQQLSRSQIKELVQLSEIYKDGGSRRTLAQPGEGPEEPAKALLAFLGVDWSSAGAKPVIEIGTIAHLIFSPEGQQEHPLRHQLKTNFSAVLTSEDLGEAVSTAAPEEPKLVELGTVDPGLVMTELLPEDLNAFVSQSEPLPPPVETNSPPGPPPEFAALGAEPSPFSNLGLSEPSIPDFSPVDNGLQPVPLEPVAYQPKSEPVAYQPESEPVAYQPEPEPVAYQPESEPVAYQPEPEPATAEEPVDVVPIPAWYLLSHDLEKMNATVTVDSHAEAEPEKDYSEQFFQDLQEGAAGPQPVETVSGDQLSDADTTARVEDFNHDIFEAAGARSSIEINPEADPITQAVRQPVQRQYSEFEPLPSEPVVQPLPDQSTSISTESRESSGLFDRLTSHLAEEVPPGVPETPTREEPQPKPQGPPTNLMDMLTADSDVFSMTSAPSAKIQEGEPDAEKLAEALNGLIDVHAKTEPVQGEPELKDVPGDIMSALDQLDTEESEPPAPWQKLAPQEPPESTFETQEMSSFVPDLQFSVKEQEEAIEEPVEEMIPEAISHPEAETPLIPEEPTALEPEMIPEAELAAPVAEPELIPEPEPELVPEPEPEAIITPPPPEPELIPEPEAIITPPPPEPELIPEPEPEPEPEAIITPPPPQPEPTVAAAPEPAPPPTETAPSLFGSPLVARIEPEPEPEPAPPAPAPVAASVPAQPAMEPKLVISESARFMARLNQRLTEAEKKLDQKSEQAIERMTARLHELTQAAEDIEKERERKSAELGASYKKHLESVVEQIKTRITEASDGARKEFDKFFMEATAEVEAMNDELVSTLRYADHRARSDSEALTETTRKNVDQHIEQKVEEYNTRTDYVCELLDSTTHYYRKQLQERFQRFKTRMSEELDSIQSSLDRNVRSMTEEIDGSWDRASEKLKSSHEEFEQTANHLVRNCEIDLDREIKRAYVEQILPKILDNKAIFRSMLQDMGRNFEEQSEKIIDEHVHGLEKNIEIAKAELNRVVFKCLTDIETVGQGQRSDLDELFNSTNSRLFQMTDEIETKLLESREDIERNQAACRQLTESSSAEEDSSLSRERTKTKTTLSEVRSRADNTLEEAIGTSCLHLDQLSEQLQKDLNKQRTDWTSQVKGSGDDGINAVRKALQDAFQAIEIAREKYME